MGVVIVDPSPVPASPQAPDSNAETTAPTGLHGEAPPEPVSPPPLTQDETVERMRREVEARRRSFIRNLRLMRDLGVKVEVVPLVPILGSPDISDWVCHPEKKDALPDPCLKHRNMRHALRGVARGDGEFSVVDNGNMGIFDQALVGDASPENMLHRHAESFLESGRSFIDPEAQIRFPAVTINVDFKDDIYWVAAWDWLAGDPFFVRGYPAEGMDQARQDRISEDLRQAIERHYRTIDFRAAVAALPPLTAKERAEVDGQTVYRINHPAGWSKADIEGAGESWQELSNTFEITLVGRAFQAEVDRERERSLIYAPLSLRLTDGAVKRLEGQALEIDGFLEGIALSVTDEGDGLRLGADPRLRWDEMEIYRDKYGNVIVPSVGFHLDTGRPYFHGFTIFPAYPLSGDPGSAPVRTLGVDLSRFGFGDHPRLLTVQSIAPVRKPDAAHPYFVYSTLPPADQEKAEGVYERASRLASRVEADFGFRPGERVQNIFLVPSSSWNATVRFANPTTFFLWDEVFGDLRGEKADFVVSHEVFHNFDVQFGFSREPEFSKMFAMLKEAEDGELFDAIDEKNFLSAGKGGHSSENVFEFIATLTNSIAAPQWAEKVAAMTPRVRGLYYHALRRLRGALVARRPQITSAPIYRLLEGRIGALESMAGAHDERTPPYPPLERLAWKPVAKVLEEGKEPIRAISGKDFAREVLQERRRPVVVVFWSGREDADISFIQRVASSLRGRAKVVAMSMDDGEAFVSKYFHGSIGTQTIYVFGRGNLVARTDPFDLPWERIPPSGREREDHIHRLMMEKVTPVIDAWNEYLRPTPIPIVGPLIDLFRGR